MTQFCSKVDEFDPKKQHVNFTIVRGEGSYTRGVTATGGSGEGSRAGMGNLARSETRSDSSEKDSQIPCVAVMRLS